MKKSPTKVVFVWHMHQPCYKHPFKPYYILPWVRLHGVKDYYGMAKTVEKFESTRVVFNFSGILLEQLLDYTQNNAQDYYSILTLKNPAQFTEEERRFVLERFFSINFDRYIRPHARYLQLHTKRLSPKFSFNVQDFRDLQAIFNLCWFHPYSLKKDKTLYALFNKKKNYTEADKKIIIDKQYDILREIFPLYQRLAAEKKIEITLTPHHHPIMPLIYDTDVLKEMPYLKKPNTRFYAPQDCRWHLAQAKEFYKKAFNASARGSWPSEGSVSEPVLSIYNEEAFNWVATDEGILFKTLTSEYVTYDMIKNQRHLIYSPYNFRGVNMLFRDRNFADMMSFTYQGWEDPVFASNDLLEHFKKTHYFLKGVLKERVITIVMDGENAWEYYDNNGVEFLETIYSNIEKSTILETDLPSRFLPHLKIKHLERLSSGSWINNDFGVWVGNAKNNHYWEVMCRIKEMIDQPNVPADKKAKAMEYFHLLEGSDWYWWNTFEDYVGEFKNIFSGYVEEIFKLLGKKPSSFISGKN